MKKVLKWIGITLGVLFIIGLLLPSKDKNSASANTENSISTAAPKQWSEVLSFKGNGMKSSPSFHLNGGNTRIKYEYQAEMKGAGVFGVYVLDQGHDLNKEGGVPDVMLSDSESGDSYVHKASGDYYLHVNASGNWKVIIEEEK